MDGQSDSICKRSDTKLDVYNEQVVLLFQNFKSCLPVEPAPLHIQGNEIENEDVHGTASLCTADLLVMNITL